MTKSNRILGPRASFSASVLLVGVLGMCAGCANRSNAPPEMPPSQVSKVVVRTLHYPNTVQVLAEGGTDDKGRPVGTWHYFYQNGAMLARGEYGPTGNFTGTWHLWNPDGTVSQERSGLRCINTHFGLYGAGRDFFQSQLTADGIAEDLEQVLPFYQEDWDGSGHYAHGVWRSQLNEDEIKASAVPHPGTEH